MSQQNPQRATEERVLAHLKKQRKAVLLDYLRAAYAEMTAKQRAAVFPEASPAPAKRVIDGGRLLKTVRQFHSDSVARKYYAPFNVNSKNFMQVPDATTQWCA